MVRTLSWINRLHTVYHNWEDALNWCICCMLLCLLFSAVLVLFLQIPMGSGFFYFSFLEFFRRILMFPWLSQLGLFLLLWAAPSVEAAAVKAGVAPTWSQAAYELEVSYTTSMPWLGEDSGFVWSWFVFCVLFCFCYFGIFLFVYFFNLLKLWGIGNSFKRALSEEW